MAKNPLRRFTKLLLIALNLLLSLLLLTGCLCAYISPEKWFVLGFISLIIPYLILLQLFFLLGWLLVKPRLVWIPLLTLVIAWQQLLSVFAWHPGGGVPERKRENILRIVNWNVQSFNGLTKNRRLKKLIPEELAASILKLAPDVICLQEFNQPGSGGGNIALFTKQYPYHYFSRDYRRQNGYQSGCIIFSRYPIVDTGRIAYPVAESLIYADLLKGSDTIRIYTTHLQSFKFRKADYDDIDRIREQDEETLDASLSLYRKMRIAFSRRAVQAGLVRNHLDQCPYASVICGDFNDVPASYTYFHIRHERQDAFLQKGFAIGRSFISLAPTLRIDYILPDNRFTVAGFEMVDENLSDHLMLVSDLLLKK
jgi:endonuclease/exonuclease/phosphatase family metal-dependent hydrolase